MSCRHDALCALAVLSACAGSGPPDDDGGDAGPAPDADVVALIGPEGGQIEHPLGAGLLVPPGALAEPAWIGISAVDDGAALLPPGMTALTGTFDFLPSGQQFQVDVELWARRTDGGVPAERGLLFYEDAGDGLWHVLGPDRGEEEGPEAWAGSSTADELRGASSHFTRIRGMTPSLSAARTLGPSPSGFTVDVHDLVGCVVRARNPRPGAAADVGGVLVHSTAGTQGAVDSACYLGDNARGVHAHYVVGREGAIVELYTPETLVPHAGGRESNARGARSLNSFLVGIEIGNSSNGAARTQPYSGIQMAALSRLVRYLVDQYGLSPPNPDGINAGAGPVDCWANHVGTGVAFHRTVWRCGGDPRSDPAGPFPEDAFWASVSEDPPPGEIRLRGGDAWGPWPAGQGGDALFDEDPSAQPAEQGAGTDLLVAAGGAASLTAGTHDYNDVWIDGTLTLDGDVDLRVFGTFWVGEDGRIDGSGGASLTVLAGGLAMVTGRVALDGADGWIPLDEAGFGADLAACAYPVDPDVEGAGADGGDFTLRSGGGPLFVPALVTLGGDAHRHDPEQEVLSGGDGGAVSIVAGAGGAFFHGSEPEPVAWVLGAHTLDFHPWGCDLSGLLDSAMQPDSPVYGAGIFTGGGTGPWSSRSGGGAELWGEGGPAGAGGDVLVDSTGLLWFWDTAIVSGCCVQSVEINPFLGSISEEASFDQLLGGLGGAGAQGVAAEGGDGGDGGTAGDVTVWGSSNASLLADTDSVLGWNGDNGGTLSLNAGPVVTGTLQVYEDGDGVPRLWVTATGGSGGGPGGSIAHHPGWFGLAGDNGTVSVGAAP